MFKELTQVVARIARLRCAVSDSVKERTAQAVVIRIRITACSCGCLIPTTLLHKRVSGRRYKNIMVLTGHLPTLATITAMSAFLVGGGGDIGEGGAGLAIGLASAMAAEPTNNVISTVILILLLRFVNL